MWLTGTLAVIVNEVTNKGSDRSRVPDSGDCAACTSRTRCTAGKKKRIRRWEHEAVLNAFASE